MRHLFDGAAPDYGRWQEQPACRLRFVVALAMALLFWWGTL